ncbi:MAG: sigma 54-dependent Fis family transcriptional regulator [Myxococcales bacterium]|nr:sigma 54-dependent Fis family transcriptional regulator [Myxococcales bacterium]MCB9645678.1 sigma 54-dependent Fis family transcriptional regulator [Deltaproteobacteria bacterium]
MSDPSPRLWRLELTVRSGPDAGRRCVVDRDVVTVGKRSDCDLVLTDDTVSRQHLRIHRTRGADGGSAWLLVDTGSTNGTWLGGARVLEAPIEAGAVLKAGTVEIAFAPIPQTVEEFAWHEDHFGGLVGRSAAMRRLFGLLHRIAPTDATVLVEGETGTGKGAVAKAIHQASARAAGPFVVVDCGAVQRQLVESELFGHERGAFTGAVAERPGAFERAHRGTVFVDELGELELPLQPKLLRVLDAREVQRVGGQRHLPVDLRFIAASRRDLGREVERGVFREDLFFRLSVVTVRLPPLRDRPEDIPLLAERFLEEVAEARGLRAPRLDAAALDRLTAHDWPGNVRELRNVMERAVLLSAVRPGQRLEIGRLQSGAAAPPAPAAPDPGAFDPASSYQAEKERWLEQRERAYVGWLMGQHQGNVSAAARAAQMDRKYLHKLLKKYET